MQNTRSRLLCETDWKDVFKDVGKFYLYLILFYGLAFLLVWGHAYISLGSLEMSIGDVLSGSQITSDAKIGDFDIERYKIIAEKMGEYMFTLVCFGVFFSFPPKKLGHAAIVAAVISLTANPPFLFKSIEEYIGDNFYLLGCMFLAWACSIGWSKFRTRKA